jgi:tetratricopeptide (TPR) repeat protein
MTRKGILLPLILLLALASSAEAAAADTIVIMPFENVSGRAEYNWVGESFAASLAEMLDRHGLVSIHSDERNVAYKQEGLPPTAILTRATMIKIAERAGANLVVLGTYRINDERDKEKKEDQPEITLDNQQEKKIERTISITARIIDIREGRMVGEFNMGGDLLELQRLQGNLAYEILYKHNQALPFSRDQILTQATKAPIGAFENYIKGTLTRDREARIGFLERAIKEYAEKTRDKYIAAIFELGRIYYEGNDFNEAVKQLSLIGEDDPLYDEAQFYLGVATDSLNQTDTALSSLQKLAPRLPLYEVYNNIGVIFIKKKQYADAVNHLKPAAEAAPRDTDTQFNLGYAYFLAKDYANSAAALKKEIERRPSDGEAFYVLSKALLAMNDQAGATQASDQAKKLLPAFAQWETKGMPVIARMKTSFSKANYYRYKRDQDDRINARNVAGSQSQQAGQPLDTARTAFLAGRDEEALSLLGRHLQTAPQSYEAHLLMGRVYERRGDFDRATNALKAAIFWNPRLVAAHVLLGRIAVLKKDCPAAQTSLDKALQIEPADQDAQALKRLIADRCS